MILDKRHDLGAFRRAVSDWLAVVVPPDWPQRMAEADDREYEAFQRWWMGERNKVGLATPHWPAQYGGADLSLEHLIILADESARANSPVPSLYVISLNHIAATLIPFGTEEQRLRYLPGVSQGVVWCQGFSEPSAGSDLASLRCRAERDGDAYVVNGQKIWSSKSMYAEYCILLARTDPAAPKHAGISYFIMDMKSPGVEVRPIRQANGRAEFGELFLTDVRIPVENLVGAENNGWQVAQATLSSERGLIAFEGAERRRYVVERFLRKAVRDDADWLKDSQLRREFMVLLTDMQANRRMIRSLFDEHSAASPNGVMAAPFVKLVNTELRQRIARFGVQVSGINGHRYEKCTEDAIDSWMFDYITSLGGKIAGGANEIMRNIVAERGLGMQKEGR
jgi:alkylation response protein AidB-like acyl-CoA dehydrogenase